MIKVILAVLAAAAVGVIVYLNVGSDGVERQVGETPAQARESTAGTKTEVTMVRKEVQTDTSPKASEVKEAEKTAKVDISTTDKAMATSRQAASNEEDIDHIGEGLTLESIEAMDVSEEEKERLRDDLALYLDRHTESSPVPSDEEIQKTIEKDLKNGFLQP